MSRPYKLLIKGTLEQKTAFSTGGNIPDSPYVDMHLARNGNHDYTLRGTGLAGAFIATARQLQGLERLPESITEGSPKNQPKRDDNSPRMWESVWIFHNSHPQTKVTPEIRDNVAISQETGAAKHTAKFDVEILPAGTKWDFLLEIDQYRDTSGEATEIALNVIQQWKKICWLGRDVARGLGWMELTDLEYYELTTDDIEKWPNSEKEPLKAIEDLDKTEEKLPSNLLKPNKPYICKKITITVGGESSDSYGVDFLSVGSHQKEKGRETKQPKELLGKKFLKKHKERLIKPMGQKEDGYMLFRDADKDTDFSLAVTQTLGGKPVPIIPGSSIRGALRHALQWLHNSTASNEDFADIDTIFGSTSQSAKLLIADAKLQTPENWQAVVLEMHAKDEFTQGVFGGGKFDRTCLTKATFTADYYLQTDSNEELENIKKELQKLKTLGANKMLPIGGGQWKGLGWVKWDIQIDTETTSNTDDNNKETAE